MSDPITDRDGTEAVVDVTKPPVEATTTAPDRRPPPVDPSGGDDEPPGPRRRPVLLAVVAGVALLVVVLVAYMAGRDAPEGTASTSSTTTAVAQPDAADFVTYTHPTLGFTLKHPPTWSRVDDAELRARLGEVTPDLVVRSGLNYVSVRVETLEQAVGPDNMADLKVFTDQIIGPEVTVLQEKQVTVNGMPGYSYLYTFKETDQEGREQEGLHLHYFLFQGNKMTALVFQALPADRIGRLEPTFNLIRDSYRTT